MLNNYHIYQKVGVEEGSRRAHHSVTADSSLALRPAPWEEGGGERAGRQLCPLIALPQARVWWALGTVVLEGDGEFNRLFQEAL